MMARAAALAKLIFANLMMTANFGGERQLGNRTRRRAARFQGGAVGLIVGPLRRGDLVLRRELTLPMRRLILGVCHPSKSNVV
jgi:hypothetical protein